MARISHQWVRSFPEPQRRSVIAAMEGASLSRVRQAMRAFDELDTSLQGPIVEVEFLCSFNLEPMLPILEFALRCIPIRPIVTLGPLNDFESYLSQPRKTEHGAPLFLRVIVWRVEEFLPEALFPCTYGYPEELVARVQAAVARVDRVVALHEQQSAGSPLFLSTLPAPVGLANSVFAAQHRDGVRASLMRINQRVYQAASSRSGVRVLDSASWAAREGAAAADVTLDFMARQPFSGAAQISFAFFVACSLRPMFVPRRKVLAVDLDDTLWGGILGEDGIQKLKLGADFPGNIYVRIQRELLELKHRGVLLVLLSKNNEHDARQAFAALPDMVLKWDDFAAHRVNFGTKSENVRQVAMELSLGLDSFAFLDDSDFEREQMRQFCPDVLVLNEKSDPIAMLKSLWDTDAFDSYSLSEEDRQRHQDYTLRVARSVESHPDNLGQFLRSLELRAVFEDIGPATLERVTQLMARTNQFNPTTRRHTQAQVKVLVEKPGSIAFALRLTDKFGSQGIVGVILVVPDPDLDGLRVDSLLVSCRALGRGVEEAIWAEVLDRAAARGVSHIYADYFPTTKNGIVANLFDRFGFERWGEYNGGTRYRCNRILPMPKPDWILVERLA